MSTENKRVSNKSKWAKDRFIKDMEKEISKMAKFGIINFTIKDLCISTSYSYRQTRRYINKSSLAELNKWEKKLSEIIN